MAGRLAAVALLAACGLVSLMGPAPQAVAAPLGNAAWSVSMTTTGAAGVAYAYTFTVATTSPLSSVTMTLPSGTGGSPAVGTVSPASMAGGTASSSAGTLTYSFAAVTVASGTAVSIHVNGITNTGSAGGYTSTITTLNGASQVDAGPTGTVTLTPGSLTSLGWSASSTAVGATGVSYTFTFTTQSTSLTITSVTFTVPPGTAGTPVLGAVSPGGLLGSISLAGTTLTFSGISLLPVAPTPFSVQVNGLTNTTTAGSYTSEIATHGTLGAGIDSGVTPAVTFTGSLNLTSPGSLTWAATLTGTSQAAADTVPGDQQFSVDDETATGAGWHITVSATTFTTGTRTLPDSGTLVFTGSTSSITTTTGPGATCRTSCTPPTNATTYPVAITTAASSPTPVTVYDAVAGSGLGPATLGGHGTASPAGWWVSIPGSVLVGAYASTVTVAVVSGP
jgi:hypothetical protein